MAEEMTTQDRLRISRNDARSYNISRISISLSDIVGGHSHYNDFVDRGAKLGINEGLVGKEYFWKDNNVVIEFDMSALTELFDTSA